jgi:hypothetical protein
MDYAVAKRFGEELLDVREFIRPGTYMVGELVARQNFARPEDAWAWVLSNIRYPWGPIDQQDRHVLMAYLEEETCSFLAPKTCRARFVYEQDDYWELPSEVLRDRMADCDGRAFLLTSILRRAFPDLPAYATVGYYLDYGHVWVAVWQDGTPPHAGGGWRVMETTLDKLPPAMPPEGPPYRPLFRFDDREVLVSRWEVPARIRDREKVEKIKAAYRVMGYAS